MIKTLGFSLPFSYLTGKELTEYDSIFGPVDTCLKTIKSTGIDSIELRNINPITSLTDIKTAINKLSECGMAITIHGSLSESDHIVNIVRFVLGIQQEAIITVHCHSGSECSTNEYAEKTIASLKQFLSTHGEKIIIALELTRSTLKNDPGTTYSGLLNILKMVNSPNLRICWDYGHTASNIANELLTATPPEEFLSAVAHTHIHDLSEVNRTHFPLTHRRVPLQKFNMALLQCGYTGCANLELNPERWSGSATDKYNAILSSIEILKQSLTH